MAAGARYDHYEIKDLAKGDETKSGDVVSPRISVMYDVLKELQARVSYSEGYRAPQIFDEDLHIESSGLYQVIHVNNPDLKQETSHSYMASLDFNKLLGTVHTGFLIEGFYTKLVDAFSSNNTLISTPNGDILEKERINSSGATVQGINMELRLKPLKNLEFSSGFTLQTSKYEEVQEWGSKKILRTPNQYGFLAIDWDFYKGFCLSATGNYTGSMLVRYEGSEDKPNLYEVEYVNAEGEIISSQLLDSENFFELGAKLSHKVKLNGASVEFLGGVKNIFNAYQKDFDIGIDRDPAYMYGPFSPRTVYFGIRFGNLL